MIPVLYRSKSGLSEVSASSLALIQEELGLHRCVSVVIRRDLPHSIPEVVQGQIEGLTSLWLHLRADTPVEVPECRVAVSDPYVLDIPWHQVVLIRKNEYCAYCWDPDYGRWEPWNDRESGD